MIHLHAAGLTDVGQVRQGNEDSMHVGDSVFAVADGMGGHAAGEVASALALEPIARLDGRVFGDDAQARSALEDAVVAANRAVVEAAHADDTLQGMGTTLTAALFEGRRLHLAHVGDSRAYLLRRGRVTQMTRDHTFVQQLIDDGSITEEEAAVHPHRSVVTRAIGASTEVEIDLETLNLASGDAVLLCSDGLSGVVADDRIAELMISDRTPQQTVSELVRAANEAGGPDNITAVLLTLMSDREQDAPETAPPTPRGPMVIRPDHDAGPARVLPGPGPDESIVVDPVARRRRLASIAVGLAVVLGLTLGGGRWLLSRSYFVGLDGQMVAIYQGVPASIGPLSPSWVVEETSLRIDDVPDFQQPLLEQGIAAVDRGDARNIVSSLRAAGEAEGAIQDRARDEGAGSDAGAGTTP
jgi:protein phosphatase